MPPALNEDARIKNVEDGDFLMDEIDLFLATDELLHSNIESDDYDSKGDIHFLEELLVNDSIPFPVNESSNFDHQDDSSFPRPPPKPPDDEFFEPEVISAVKNNNDELNEDNCFDPGGTREQQQQVGQIISQISYPILKPNIVINVS
nr:hypothetical protein [Tanacetum cinerariifolium]